jgi:hypothetical protein
LSWLTHSAYVLVTSDSTKHRAIGNISLGVPATLSLCKSWTLDHHNSPPMSEATSTTPMKHIAWKDLFKQAGYTLEISDAPDTWFEEARFSAALLRWQQSGRVHRETLIAKRALEGDIQNLFDQTWSTKEKETALEGCCECGDTVGALVKATDCVLNVAANEKMTRQMHANHAATLSLFGIHFDTLHCELDVCVCISPLLLRPRSVPSTRLLRDSLSVIDAMFECFSNINQYPLSHIAEAVIIANDVYSNVNRVVLSKYCAVSEFADQIKDVARNMDSFEQFDKFLQSPTTLESDAVNWTHIVRQSIVFVFVFNKIPQYLLRRVLQLGPNAHLASALVTPSVSQLCNNRWLYRALAHAPLHVEHAYLTVLSTFPFSDLESLSPSQVQSFVLLPIQKALDEFAPQSYVKLAQFLTKVIHTFSSDKILQYLTLSQIVICAANSFPMLVTKCVALLATAPPTFSAVCVQSLMGIRNFSLVSEDDRVLILATLVRLRFGSSMCVCLCNIFRF